MRPGSPFKYRGPSTPYIGMLTTPDVLKYKIPIPFAFVPPNPSYDPKEIQVKKGPVKRQQLISSSEFQYNSECQKTIKNYNKCIHNNRLTGIEVCLYYLNYLNTNCKK